jgi:hypothetical protein
VRRVLGLASALVLTSSICYGQEVTPDMTAGSKALLFTFNGLSVLSAGNFDGGGGFKYFIQDGLAVRGALIVANGHSTLAANPVAPATGTDGSVSGTTGGFSAALERHLSKNRASPYIGAGGSFTVSSTDAKNVVVGNPPPPQTTIKNAVGGETINGQFFQAGKTGSFFGLIGFEFFFKKEISFAGEYRLGYSTTSRKNQDVILNGVTTTTKVGDSHQFNLASQGLFTLAVYF